jgi:hypothetical protein
MANIKQFRDYDDHDVINLFTVNDASLNKGTFVQPSSSAGINLSDATLVGSISPYSNSQSALFSVPWKVTAATSGKQPHEVVGMLLKDHRSVDENGENLVFKPRKAAEMDVTTSGQAAPIVTKGVFLYSGIVGTPGFGSGAAIGDSSNGELKVVAYTTGCVGKFLGAKDANGFALLKINL